MQDISFYVLFFFFLKKFAPYSMSQEDLVLFPPMVSRMFQNSSNENMRVMTCG